MSGFPFDTDAVRTICLRALRGGRFDLDREDPFEMSEAMLSVGHELEAYGFYPEPEFGDRRVVYMHSDQWVLKCARSADGVVAHDSEQAFLTAASESERAYLPETVRLCPEIVLQRAFLPDVELFCQNREEINAVARAMGIEDVSMDNIGFAADGSFRFLDFEYFTPREDVRIRPSARARLQALFEAEVESEVFCAYHGTNTSFTEFDSSRIGSGTDEGHLGRGFYFSTDPDVARSSKWRISADVSLRSPLRIAFPSFASDKRILIREALGLERDASVDEVTAALRHEGHDGVVLDYSPTGYGHQEILALDVQAITVHFCQPVEEKRVPHL